MAKMNQSKKFAVTSLAATTAIAGIAPAVVAADDTVDFTDVDPVADKSHYDAIQWLAQNGGEYWIS